jgi:hypothetical protein
MTATSFAFLTMNNVTDPADLDPAKGECVDLVNVDTDNRGGVCVRDALVSGLTAQPLTEIMGSRAYWAVGNTVYCSRAMEDDEDERFSIVISLDDMITMIRRVDGGLYIGSTTELHFLAGTDPQGEGFTDQWTLPYGVIAGTGCHVRGELVPVAQMMGNCCIFASHRGVIVGGPGGQIVNLSQGKVSYEYGLFGSAMVREQGGQAHYLFTTSNVTPAHNPLGLVIENYGL